MDKLQKRRSFLKSVVLGGTGIALSPGILKAEDTTVDIPNAIEQKDVPSTGRKYNTPYTGEYLNRVAFPIGGLGAGMFCLEGAGAISHTSICNRPEIFNEPSLFSAIAIKGLKNGVKVLEGQVPDWKMFGARGTGNGAAGATYGLPRFQDAEFKTHFPFATIQLKDADIPLQIAVKGWSPFIPTDEDNSSLPVGALEYIFTNKTTQSFEAVFSFNTKNFLANTDGVVNKIAAINNGFILKQDAAKDKPEAEASFAVFTDDDKTIVDHCWFRGGWWDPLTMAWNTVNDGKTRTTPPVEKDAPGASLFVPFTLAAGASKTIRLMMTWYVPETNMHIGEIVWDEKKDCSPESGCCAAPEDLGAVNGKKSLSSNYKPWYSSRFANIDEVADYWKKNYTDLHSKSTLFSEAFYASTLPPEVMEAVAANLTILKSPTVLRQYDGRLWAWEGCGDDGGCCHGSCTHV
ncbi:GH116 family glycosyl-hydrolase, partial [Parafilimonas sp.]|uniref:GH116 family glycosyl-hydrolase n=1 Tax=Parafilimonas sp. TaxID=1969739 RepID=UPI0039E62A74